MHYRILITALLAGWLAGCAAPVPVDEVRLSNVTPFSLAQPGAAPPGGWQVWTLAKFKRPTSYDLISKDGATVVEARADGSASGLLHPLDRLDAKRYRDLAWRWKIEGLIPNQDNTRSAFEDSAARLVVRFDGDASKLDFAERMFAAKVKAVTGQALPYATLMYIWGRNIAPDTVITSRHTDRIKMIVAEAGVDKAGAWHDLQRDLYADFKRAFGEEPGPITGIGIMTDTDNTGEKARAWYGDIRLLRAPH